MNNNIPPSSTPGDDWHRLHNYLQTRGWKERLYTRKWKGGSEDAPTWHVECTFDGEDYGRGAGNTLMGAKNHAARVVFRRLLYEEAMPLIERRLAGIS